MNDRQKRPRGTGAIFSVPGSRFLWVGYTDAKGEYVRESSKEVQRTKAQKFLDKRLQAVASGNFLGPQVDRITVDELYDDLLQDYRTHGQFVPWPERCWNAHLKDYFGGMKAVRVGTTQIAGYVEKRQGE